MFKAYIAYIKNNPKGYWFKAKLYGWGWTPATWQGWTVFTVFLLLMGGNFVRIDRMQHSASDTLLNFIPQTWILIGILLLICSFTGEKPRWQWGPRKDT